MSVLDLFRLDGKRAIVTGASRGIGRAMAKALAEAGADVATVARGDMSEVKTDVEGAGRKCVPITADVSDMQNMQRIVDETVGALGGVDILVNNSGIIRRAPMTEFTETDWDEVMDVNLKAVFFLSQAVCKQFIEQKTGGKIISTASMLSFQGGIRIPSYTASKSGVMGLTRLMACELAEHNIQANAIAPGYIETDATEALRNDPQRSSQILARIPAGRWGTPEDMMGAVVFLASPASDYMTGYTIAVDGGWLAR